MLSGLSFKRLIITSLSVLFCAVVALVNPGKSSATTLPVVHESGTLSADETWSAGSVYMIDSTVTVPSGITLTIDHGAIVKYASLFSGSITVSGGTLDVTGTSADPVTFTSANDDSVGGDSTNNGATNGSVGNYATAITASDGTLNLAYGVFNYATVGVSGSTGTITISDTVFNHLSQEAITDYASNLSLERNTFNLQDGSAPDAISVSGISDLTGIVLSGVNANVFTGNRTGGTALNVGGVVPSGLTWNVSALSGVVLEPNGLDVAGTLDLPTGVTYSVRTGTGITVEGGGVVNMPAGAVLKIAKAPANYNSVGIQVNTGGILNVTGSAAEPVIFTSSADDSIGGDTTENGATSGVAGDYLAAVRTDGGTANVVYSEFNYATVGIAASTGVLSVTDSTFNHIDQQGVTDYASNLSLERNTFNLQDGTGSDAVEASGISNLSGIALSGANTNTFTATRTGGVAVSVNGVVPSNVAWGVGSESSAMLETNGVDVIGSLDLSSGITYSNRYGVGITADTGGTVNIPAGAVLKVAKTPYGWNPTAVQVNAGGILNVSGTSIAPVTFTSSNDDSIGGDTTGNGPTNGLAGDYLTAIRTDGGTLNVTHGIFNYANNGIIGSTGSISVSDSTFNHIDQQAITDYASNLSLERNTFNLQDGSSSDAIEVTAIPNLAGIILSGTNANTFTATRVGGIAVNMNGTIPSASTLDVDTASGAMLEPNGIDVSGTLGLPTGVTYSVQYGTGITVESGGTLNVPAGAIFKVFKAPYGWNPTAVSVNGGTLNVTGTAVAPVIFTSSKDDSVGGDTTGDGSSTGSAGDYTKAISQTGGTVNVSHATFKYAQQPISITAGDLTVGDSSLSGVDADLYQAGGTTNISGTSLLDASNAVYVYNGTLMLRGTFSNISGRYITACNWNASCMVDAAYTDWGSADGPLNTNPANNLVCGSVTVAPWTHGGSTYNQNDNPNLYSVRNCDNSSTPDTAMSSAITNFQQGISNREIDCSGGYQAACDAIDSAYACLSGAMNVAQSTTPWPLPGSSTADDVSAFGGLMLNGAANYMTSQEVVSPLGSGLDFFNQLASVAGTLVTMANAYNSCAP